MNFGLSNIEINKLRSAFYRIPSIEKVVVFGSRARGDFKYNSDIDLAIFGSDLTSSDLLELDIRIDELMMPYYVDLINAEVIDNERLEKFIHSEGQTLFELGNS